MPSPLHDLIVARIRAGPVTAAEFLELALYHPEYGYYSTLPHRSGRRGDFITSVDLGPLFGEMLAIQLEEMWRALGRPRIFDVVEAGAGDGRLMRDVLDAASTLDAEFCRAVRVTLVERSAAGRTAHDSMLGPHVSRRVRSQGVLPERIEGVIVANELLDAMPVHLVVMTGTGLREIYVTSDGDRFRESVGPVSTPLIADYLRRTGITPEEGVRFEVGLEAAAWIRTAAHRLRYGFILLFDYGYDAQRLLTGRGTLCACRRHAATPEDWLRDPGENDITSHVNLTAIDHEAEIAGLTKLGATDQTYFLMGAGIINRLSDSPDLLSVARRRAATSLVLPEGLGGIQKVVVYGRNVGRPRLRGLSRSRLT